MSSVAEGRLSIGEVSKRTGIPVKTLRFYSDEGIVPPSGRTRSNYRLYSEADVVRLDLVRTLREAGVGLEAIRSVLRREISLADVLRLRLGTVEAHIASLQHVAAALRAALRSEPTEHDIRRISAVTRLSNEERRTVIARFYERVSDGLPVDPQWKTSMIDALAPKLPDVPTPEQLDAWIEMSEILNDPKFIESMRAMSKETWSGDFDAVAYQRATGEIVREARAAMDAGHAPSSAEGKRIATAFADVSAKATRREVDDKLLAELHDKFLWHDPRASRLWELAAFLQGRPAAKSHVEEWRWISDAIVHHFGTT